MLFFFKYNNCPIVTFSCSLALALVCVSVYVLFRVWVRDEG